MLRRGDDIVKDENNQQEKYDQVKQFYDTSKRNALAIYHLSLKDSGTKSDAVSKKVAL